MTQPYTPGSVAAAFDRLIANHQAVYSTLTDDPVGAKVLAKVAATLTPERIEAARSLVTLIEGAFLFTDPDRSEDVLWLRQQLERRFRRRWAQLSGKCLETPHPPFIELYRGGLGQLDPRAATLTTDNILGVVADFGIAKGKRAPMSTVAGLAARLAVLCGAFGYVDYDSARLAFKSALKTPSGLRK